MSKVNGRQQTSRKSKVPELDVWLTVDDEAAAFAPEDEAGLTAQQWRAVQLLVSGMRQVDVANELDMAQETLSRWRSQPMFAAALNATIKDCWRTTVDEVRQVASEAVDVLRSCLKSGDDKVRLRAALAVLDLHQRLHADIDELPVTPADVARQQRRQQAEKRHRDMIGL